MFRSCMILSNHIAANICTCSNGTPALATGNAGTFCENDGDEDCSACGTG
jgi:hypothetical protein